MYAKVKNLSSHVYDAEIGCWMYASQRQVARIRLEFLSAVLKQEIGAFDTDLNSGENNHWNKQPHVTHTGCNWREGTMLAQLFMVQSHLLTLRCPYLHLCKHKYQRHS